MIARATKKEAPAPAATGDKGLMPKEGTEMNSDTMMTQEFDLGEWRASMVALRAKWLADHAEAVAAVMPAWADPDATWVDITSADEEADSIEFSRVVGSVTIDQSCDITNGVLSLIDGPSIHVNFQDEAEFGTLTALQVGHDLVQAATFVETGAWI